MPPLDPSPPITALTACIISAIVVCFQGYGGGCRHVIVSPDAGGAFGPDYGQHFADAGIADRDGSDGDRPARLGGGGRGGVLRLRHPSPNEICLRSCSCSFQTTRDAPSVPYNCALAFNNSIP